MLIINLALSDLGISVFGYPLTMLSCFAGRWIFGMVGCTVQGFTTFVFALSDMYTLTVVSVYRWIAVCLPQYNHRLTVSLTLKVIGAEWILCIVICAFPLVGMSSYTPEPFGTSCTIDWDDPQPASVFYVYLLILIAYLVPVGIMFYCYYKVVIRSGEIMRSLKQTAAKTLNIGEAETANVNLAESKVTWISLAMVAAFLVVWSPYALLSVVAIHKADIALWLTTLPTMCCKASCALNPIIFYLTNPTFRRTFRATFCRSKKVAPSVPKSFILLLCRAQTFKVDKTRDGIFIGEANVTFRQADTTMF
nr:hypothetical protein BaRGS_005524 [Batillaria attramentaria]